MILDFTPFHHATCPLLPVKVWQIDKMHLGVIVIHSMSCRLPNGCCRQFLLSHALMCRLFENTFQLDVLSARDFCEADDRWAKAVQVLDTNAKAGWELLAAMLNPDWRLRPTAQSCLVHRFLTMN